MNSAAVFLRLLLIFLLISIVYTEIPHRRYEYKCSFKPPYLAQRDGTIPFWTYGGNAIASSDNIRLAPSLKSQKGAIWLKNPINFDWWDVELTFRVTGRGRLGADGMAFWYVEKPGEYDGTIFGSSDKWNGLGIFFDSFDNDNKHNNPYIMAVLNNGTMEFDHANDGHGQMISGCMRDFRNKPFFTGTKIEYYKNTLTVLYRNGHTQNDNDYEVCMRVENVLLPKNGYFGVSAATGGLADDHDIKEFIMHSLHPPGSVIPVVEETKAEDKKITQEYDEYQRKLDQQREQYKKEHPEAHKEEEMVDEWFESDSQRELRQVYTVQSQMYETIRLLGSKLDEVIGRQERALSLLSAVHTGVGSAQLGQPDGRGPVGTISTIQRHEVEAILSTEKELANAAAEIRKVMSEVHRKTESVLQNQMKQPTAQVHSVGYDSSAVTRELQDSVNSLRRDFAAWASSSHKVSAQAACPIPNCISTTTFIIFIAVQLLLLVAYFLYRDHKEAHAKKFY